MPRNDGINRTLARNRDLKAKDIANAQAHNEREKTAYSNPDIVPEESHRNVHYKKPTQSYTELFDLLKKEGVISTRGLKEDATTYCELLFDVNSAYFYNHGGYEFAKQFYADAYKAAVEIVGGEQYILSATMHADERNRAMSEALGEDVYHYHLHVVYIPVVEKQILWSKRCKDKALIGTVKETIMQVSRSKKWNSQQAVDESGQPMFSKTGKPILVPSYSVLQDTFFQAMRKAGYTDIERGKKGSTEEHLTVTQFKVQAERKRLEALQEQSHTAEETLSHLQEEQQTAQQALSQIQDQQRSAEETLSQLQGQQQTAQVALNQIQGKQQSAEQALSQLQRKQQSAEKELEHLRSENYAAEEALEALQERQRSAEEKTTQALQRMEEIAPKLEAIEAIAKDFTADPEQLLPTAGTLESAKSYREKKAKPLWNKLVTFLRSIYRAYLDLKERYDTLQQRFFRERMRTDDMADRIAELTEQNKQLTAQNKQSTQALETLKQAFGKEKVESAMKATKASTTTPEVTHQHSGRQQHII